jgi:hypothetical protein
MGELVKELATLLPVPFEMPASIAISRVSTDQR